MAGLLSKYASKVHFSTTVSRIRWDKSSYRLWTDSSNNTPQDYDFVIMATPLEYPSLIKFEGFNPMVGTDPGDPCVMFARLRTPSM